MNITKQAFNANTQQMEDCTITIDHNLEYVFTFEDGSFFKLPNMPVEEIQAKLSLHEEHNKGKVSTAEINSQIKEMTDKLSKLK